MNERCQHDIEWNRLFRAEMYYRTRVGSQYVETPWIVDEDVALITTDSQEIRTSRGRLVGSAEQGFIQLWRDGELREPGLYHSISPCFRDDVRDDLHERHFMKLELFYLLSANENFDSTAHRLMGYAQEIFRIEGLETDIEVTGAGTYDLVSRKKRIEVGSYGCRMANFGPHANFAWAYATGMALPRFSRALELEG